MGELLIFLTGRQSAMLSCVYTTPFCIISDGCCRTQCISHYASDCSQHVASRDQSYYGLVSIMRRMLSQEFNFDAECIE